MSLYCETCGQELPRTDAERRNERVQIIMSTFRVDKKCAEFLEEFGDLSRLGHNQNAQREAAVQTFQGRIQAWNLMQKKQKAAGNV